MSGIEVVYAMARALLPSSTGRSILIVKGSHWPVTDPVVKGHPQLFSPDPRWGMHYSVEPEGYNDPIGGAVEAATATPGERRAVRRG